MSVKKIFRKKTHVSPKTKRVVQTQNNLANAKSDTKKITKNGKSLVIAREIKFAKLLAGNDKRVRDKVLKNLRKWLTIRSESTFAFVEHDFMRLWKGLYYCMWMSDKPLIQEELAESLSKLVHCFNDRETALLYTRCTLKTLAAEWFGIDQYRLDKFQMLVRRIIRQTFEVCKKRSWDQEWVKGFAKVIESVLLESKITIGFGLHVTELYLEELAKVSSGDIPENVVLELVRPFAIQLAGMNDERQIRHVMKHIFRYLLFQSDVGLDYMEKFEAWRHAGFPGGSIDSIQKVEVGDDEDDSEAEEEDGEENEREEQEEDKDNQPREKPLDPRAGRVDVELPQIPFDPKSMADLLGTYRFYPSSTTKTRRQIVRLIKEFNELAEGKMPIGVKEVRVRDGSKAETNPKSAALRLLKFEQELYSDTADYKRKKSGDQKTEEDIGLDKEVIPTKKKLKSESGMSTKKQNESETKPKDDVSKLEGGKAVSGKAKLKTAKLKKKQGTLKPVNSKEDTDTVVEPSKKKRKKNIKRKLDSEDKTNPLENGTSESSENINKSTKQKLVNGDTNCSVSALSTPAKKTLAENGTKKIRRNSVEGDWSVSEVVSPLSPSRKNLSKSVSNISDKSDSISQPQSDRTLSWLTPVRTKNTTKETELKISKLVSVVTPQSQIIKDASSSSSKKKVKIVLQRNTAQHTFEYMRQLRLSPAIPFDANRKPLVGVLKPSPIPSPVNPFYRRSLK